MLYLLGVLRTGQYDAIQTLQFCLDMSLPANVFGPKRSKTDYLISRCKKISSTICLSLFHYWDNHPNALSKYQLFATVQGKKIAINQNCDSTKL